MIEYDGASEGIARRSEIAQYAIEIRTRGNRPFPGDAWVNLFAKSFGERGELK
jgi:hypothetical protein